MDLKIFISPTILQAPITFSLITVMGHLPTEPKKLLGKLLSLAWATILPITITTDYWISCRLIWPLKIIEGPKKKGQEWTLGILKRWKRKVYIINTGTPN